MKTLIASLLAVGLLAVTASAKDTDIAVTELPKVVSEAVMKAHPGATLVSAQKDTETDGTIQNYQVKVKVGDDEKDVKLKPDGTIISDDKP